MNLQQMKQELNEVQNFIANWEPEWGSFTFSQAEERETYLIKKISEAEEAGDE